MGMTYELFYDVILTRTNSVVDDVTDYFQIVGPIHSNGWGESIMECTLCHIRRAGGADLANIIECHRVSGIIA